MSRKSKTKERVRDAIVEEAKKRVAGHYSGHLKNGSFYDIELTVENFIMDMTLELDFIGITEKDTDA